MILTSFSLIFTIQIRFHSLRWRFLCRCKSNNEIAKFTMSSSRIYAIWKSKKSSQSLPLAQQQCKVTPSNFRYYLSQLPSLRSRSCSRSSTSALQVRISMVVDVTGMSISFRSSSWPMDCWWSCWSIRAWRDTWNSSRSKDRMCTSRAKLPRFPSIRKRHWHRIWWVSWVKLKKWNEKWDT